jgi:hypothetical protein
MRTISADEFTQLSTHSTDLSSLNIEDDIDITMLSNTFKTFQNVFFKALVIKSQNKQTNSLYFSGCSIESLLLTDLSIKHIHFDNCRVKTLVFFSGFSEEFRISTSNEQASSGYQSIVIGNGVRSLKNLFIGNASVDSLDLQGRIGTVKVDNCSINKINGIGASHEFSLSTVTNGDLYNLESDGSVESVSISKCDVKKLNLKNCKAGTLSIYAGFIDEIELKPKSCSDVAIRGISFFDKDFGQTTPSHRINKISLSNWKNIKETTFFFAFLQLKEFSAHEINYLNNALFDTISVSENFTIMDSTLIKCRFHKVKLRDCKIHLFDTFLQDCDLVNVKWPERHLINEAVDSYSQYESIREVYRQLKKVSLSQNDKIGALEFQTNEMRMHYSHLYTKPNKTLRDYGNFLIVGTHKWASDFGQNIWKPILFLFAFHLLFFALLSVLELQIYPSVFRIDWSLTYEMFNAYFITILPTHSPTLLIQGGEQNIGGWLDFIIRVSSGYFLFYFIYSSRKYHQ